MKWTKHRPPGAAEPELYVYWRDPGDGGGLVVHVDTPGVPENEHGPLMTVYINDDLANPVYDNQEETDQ